VAAITLHFLENNNNMKHTKLEKLKSEIIPLMTRLYDLQSVYTARSSHEEQATHAFEVSVTMKRLNALNDLYEKLMNADLTKALGE
jgi:hypothetical protein